jgi:hypothetical protein
VSEKQTHGHGVKTWIPSGEAIIFRLPDELISEIHKFTLPAWYGWNYNGGDYYGQALALTRVCKRFNRIAQSLLYRSLLVENACGLVPPCVRAERLYRTMKADPSLGRFCKQLKVYISDVSDDQSTSDYAIANQLFCWLPNVTSFDLQGGFNRGNGSALWALIQRAAKHMPFIKQVRLCREDIAGLLLLPIIENLNLPRLENLELHGISGVVTGRNSEDRQEHYGAQPKEVSSLVDALKYRLG